MGTPVRWSFVSRLLAGLALGCALTAAVAPAAPIATAQTLAEADKLWEEKSYAGALEGYERFLAAGQVPAERRDEIQYRVAVSLGKSEKWDRALEYTLDFVKAHRGTVWEPRALYWFGRLYLGVPHNGYRVGSKIYRGNDVPQTGAAEKAEQVWLGEQDQTNARDALEAARVLYPKFRAAHTEPEEIQLDFDLATVLQSDPQFYTWASTQKWAPPADPTWHVDPAAEYSPEWPQPKRLMYVYAQLRALATRPAVSDTHPAALGLLAKALWLRSYHQQMLSYAVRWENGKQVKIPYPYQDVKAEEVLRQLVREYPTDPVRDQAQFTLATNLESDGRFVDAVAELRRLIAERPQSKWVADAKYHLQETTRRQLSVDRYGTFQLGKPVEVNVGSRNVKSVHFELFRVKLEDVLGRPEVLNDPGAGFNTYYPNFTPDPTKLSDKYYGPLVARWDASTKDKGDYHPQNQSVKVPVKDVGAYIVEASAPGVRSATLIVVSDTVLVQKLSRDDGIYYLTESKTGRPVPNAQVIAKQYWTEGPTRFCAVTRGKTNADGIYVAPLQRGPNRTQFSLTGLGYAGSRYAITEAVMTWDNGSNPDTYQVYSVTDRAVYRPMQPVHYRQMVMRRERGQLKPAADEPVRVEVRDPRGNQIYQQQGSSNEFGTVSGDFLLPENAALGQYYINVTLPTRTNGSTQAGGNRFRVEEYKKPEFEVTVKPAAGRVRVGEPTSAGIHAEYYFGGPVPKAKVSYRVYRTYWGWSYTFPRPFDFLYRYSNNGDYETYYRNGQVVAQGETRTDDRGEAEVSFKAEAMPGANDGANYAFTIEADVQDASRRVISGTGSVKATPRDVAVFLDFPRGYATRGDHVEVEVVSVNPSNEPVSVSGTAKVLRRPETPDGKETVVHEEPLKTDSHGRGYLKWTADRAGAFRVAFETKDTAGLPVSGSTELWVAGPELEKGRFLFRDVALKVENYYYEEGQTAKVLLITPEPNCSVLLTREANNEVTEKTVVRVPGRALELKLPIRANEAPNFYLSAVMIRDGQMFQATQEVFVPPVRQFVKVQVEAGKTRYEPGEKAKLRLIARDWQNRPLRTELSVSIADASLGYIQKDFAPDIRLYYYGNRRSLSVPSNGSPALHFGAGFEDTQPRDTFQTHEWVLPEGMGQLADWPGDRAGYNWRYMYGYGNGYYRGFGPTGGGFGGGGMGGFGGDRLSMAANAPAAPGAQPQMLRKAAAAEFRDEAAAKKPGEPGGGDDTRSNFADTAFWTPAVVTDAKGEASVEVTWPDNLTRWRAVATGSTVTAAVGSGETDVVTKKDLLVRLQAPRFFVERDQVVVSANVHNYLPAAAHVKVQLQLGDDTAALASDTALLAGRKADDAAVTAVEPELWVDVPKDGEKRVDWILQVKREGSLRVRIGAQSPKASDAIATTYPVLVHGVERMLARSGVMRGQARGEQQLSIELPRERKPGSSELVVTLNPSLGAVMLDALPYLIEYPYGCIEQTLSRVVPAAVVAKTLSESGVKLEELKERLRLIEERQAADDRAHPDGATVKNSPYSYPKGRPGNIRVKELSEPQRRWHSPVFDTDEMNHIVQEGLARVASFQNPDGGWGWWPGNASDPYMTAYALYALQTAREADQPVDPQILERGLTYMRGRYLEDDNFHRMAFEARVLAMDPRYRESIRPLTAGRLYENRERLSAYSRALLAMALHGVGEQEKAETMLRNIETTAKTDDANGTVSWNDAPGGWWCWWNNKVETNAAVLQAYMEVQPSSGIPPMMVKWLVNNRRGNCWYSTKETAMAVYALADYVRENKELWPEYSLTVDLGGKVKRSYTVTRENALLFDNSFVVPDELLDTGAQTLTITKDGPGTLYYAAYTRYFSLEEPIKATGNEIFVKRRYFRLKPNTASGAVAYKPLDVKRPNPFLTGQYELLSQGGEATGTDDVNGGPRYEREPLKDGDTVTSGDQIEVELQLESKNDYEYLVFEDMKPSGCEPVEQRSGYKAGSGAYSYMELRDQKVAFFFGWLPQGKRTITYRLRAEIPGRFHVLPTNGYAMYAPDIRCLSEESDLRIRDE